MSFISRLLFKPSEYPSDDTAESDVELNGMDIGEWLESISIHQKDIPKRFRQEGIETVDDLAAHGKHIPVLLQKLNLNGFRRSKIQFAIDAFVDGSTKMDQMYAVDLKSDAFNGEMTQAGRLKILLVAAHRSGSKRLDSRIDMMVHQVLKGAENLGYGEDEIEFGIVDINLGTPDDLVERMKQYDVIMAYSYYNQQLWPKVGTMFAQLIDETQGKIGIVLTTWPLVGMWNGSSCLFANKFYSPIVPILQGDLMRPKLFGGPFPVHQVQSHPILTGVKIENHDSGSDAVRAGGVMEDMQKECTMGCKFTSFGDEGPQMYSKEQLEQLKEREKEVRKQIDQGEHGKATLIAEYESGEPFVVAKEVYGHDCVQLVNFYPICDDARGQKRLWVNDGTNIGGRLLFNAALHSLNLFTEPWCIYNHLRYPKKFRDVVFQLLLVVYHDDDEDWEEIDDEEVDQIDFQNDEIVDDDEETSIQHMPIEVIFKVIEKLAEYWMGDAWENKETTTKESESESSSSSSS